MRPTRGNGWLDRLTDLLDRFFPRAPKLVPVPVPIRGRSNQPPSRR